MPDVTPIIEVCYLRGALKTCRKIFPHLFDGMSYTLVPPMRQTADSLLEGLQILSQEIDVLAATLGGVAHTATISNSKLQLLTLMNAIQQTDEPSDVLEYEVEEGVDSILESSRFQFDHGKLEGWESFERLIYKSFDDLDHFLDELCKHDRF